MSNSTIVMETADLREVKQINVNNYIVIATIETAHPPKIVEVAGKIIGGRIVLDEYNDN